MRQEHRKELANVIAAEIGPDRMRTLAKFLGFFRQGRRGTLEWNIRVTVADWILCGPIWFWSEQPEELNS